MHVVAAPALSLQSYAYLCCTHRCCSQVAPGWPLRHVRTASAPQVPSTSVCKLQARMNVTVLIIMINNPNSISPGAGDPRLMTLTGIGRDLQRRGHRVLIDGAGALSLERHRALRGAGLDAFTWLNTQTLRRLGKPRLTISWAWYLKDRWTRVNPLAEKILRDPSIPHLLYENGMTKGCASFLCVATHRQPLRMISCFVLAASAVIVEIVGRSVTIDPLGFLGESYYFGTLNGRVQQQFNDTACRAHIRTHLLHDTSKRPQSAKVDVPSTIMSKYVFVPTQKFSDLSVRSSGTTFPQLLGNVTSFCSAYSLPLVIKIHPHLTGKLLQEQKDVIRRLRRRYKAIFVSEASINFLTSGAYFTVTLNGGTLMDNFYTTTPVLTLARGFFTLTDAVISDHDPMRGLERMRTAGLPWSEERQQRQRQVVCWYDRMSLHMNGTGSQNVAVLQRHIEALALAPAQQVWL